MPAKVLAELDGRNQASQKRVTDGLSKPWFALRFQHVIQRLGNSSPFGGRITAEWNEFPSGSTRKLVRATQQHKH